MLPGRSPHDEVVEELTQCLAFARAGGAKAKFNLAIVT